jgi:hypothetical protein
MLSEWMAARARVAWAETLEPWLWEERSLATFDLPLNLQANPESPILRSVDGNPRAGTRTCTNPADRHVGRHSKPTLTVE